MGLTEKSWKVWTEAIYAPKMSILNNETLSAAFIFVLGSYWVA